MGRPSVLRQISAVCFVVCAGGTHLGCNALRLSGNPVAPLTGTGAFDWTNGNKVVVEPLSDGLHAVYADTGKIKYVRSRDGAGWSTPIVISGSLPGCREPAIAVGTCGQLGVAFRCLNALYYTYGGGTSWSTKYLVDSFGSQPSLAASADTIYLAYNAGTNTIRYLTFPINSNPGSNSEYVTFPGPLNFSKVEVQFPSIAVTNTTPNRIFVAYMEQVDLTNAADHTCSAKTYCACNPWAECFWNRAIVVERLGAPCQSSLTGTNWCYSFISADHFDKGSVISKPAYLAPCSLSISGSGHLVFAWSEVWQNTPRTMLAHSTSGALGSWTVSPLLPKLTTTDILAAKGTSFRVAWSELANLNGHGPTFYNTGDWPSGPAPTFQSPTLVTTGTAAGRSPQALLWSRSCKNGGGSCSIATIFEEESSTFSLKQDSTCASATGPPTCFSPIPPECFAQ